MEDLKMLQEIFTLLNLDFNMIYILHKILLLLKNQQNHVKHSIFKCFFKEYNRLILKKKTNNIFHNITGNHFRLKKGTK